MDNNKTMELAEKVRWLNNHTPNGEIIDGDTILKDMFDEFDDIHFLSISNKLIELYEKSEHKDNFEELFYALVEEEFDEYLKRCVDFTTRNDKVNNMVGFIIHEATEQQFQDFMGYSLCPTSREEVENVIFQMPDIEFEKFYNLYITSKEKNKKKFVVTYNESYSRDYEVEAESKEEAEEIIKKQIYNGELDGPDNCYDSSCYVEEVI